uniref:Uncharacterized protein n=1 Tax=Fusarium oxysporum (strain Fo5176) TaxID=660025 RepID=A0A0D2XBA5_FUSOF
MTLSQMIARDTLGGPAGAQVLAMPLWNVNTPHNLDFIPPSRPHGSLETVATSFEKDACKTKDNAPKGKTRSSSLLTISSGFTFLAALPGGSSSSSSFRSSSFR